MRILVHEFVTGGGFAGRAVPVSLAREGAAIRTALIADLAAWGRHEIVTTTDSRFPLAAPAGVEVVPILPGREALSDTLIGSADAVWLVAPETGRCLERLTARVERKRTMVLGSSAAAIHRASDKGRLPHRLARCGLRHPVTRVLGPRADPAAQAREIGYPVVVKPMCGAGCIGVCLARDARELSRAVHAARRGSRTGPLLLQRYVPGVAASASLLCDGRRAVALSVNAQSVRTGRTVSYHGGRTPLDHPLAKEAMNAALRACEALPGLRGYVGVDLVLAESEIVVIEVNPRLTTSYLGVRSAFRGSDGKGANIAALAIAACAGKLPDAPVIRQSVQFTSAGRIKPLS
jgi:predicted ATP-grasp superfamily ATP-dependent carboligase